MKAKNRDYSKDIFTNAYVSEKAHGIVKKVYRKNKYDLTNKRRK